MNTYGALLAESGLPAWLHDVSQGAFSFQADIGYDAPAAWYTCPPALIPLASDGSMPDYLGIWTRWFSKDPHLHVVITGPEDRFLLREIALTAEQFATWILVKAMIMVEDFNEDLEAFSRASGLEDLPAILKHIDTYGDNPESLPLLPVFRSPKPHYLGDPDWNSFGITLPPDSAPTGIAGFERQHRPDNLPPPVGGFRKALTDGDLAGAWALLNSPGWRLPDARDAAMALAKTAGDPDFTKQMTAWCSFSEDAFIPASDAY